MPKRKEAQAVQAKLRAAKKEVPNSMEERHHSKSN